MMLAARGFGSRSFRWHVAWDDKVRGQLRSSALVQRFWPEGELLARPLFGRCRGQTGRAADIAKATRMTRLGRRPDILPIDQVYDPNPRLSYLGFRRG
jgi:hypothetical protein